MSRLEIKIKSKAQSFIDVLNEDMERRLIASPPGHCPVNTALSFVDLCSAQSCGKCVPCRIGLVSLGKLLRDVLDGKAESETVALIRRTAEAIQDSADCAIGYDAARLVLDSIDAFQDDYMEHVEKNRCLAGTDVPIPCVGFCPAHVDIPGYIALVGAGRCADAVRLIRKDNPFPVTCGYICEHPCERFCRRGMLDEAINIRGLKRYAVDTAGIVPVPACAAPTGKKVAVIGGGPGGLSAAYYLALMGHEVTVYERRKQLGGMLRYGIPSYRFPRELLDQDIDAILSTGIKVETEADIGKGTPLESILNAYDSVFISVGAHTDNKLGIPGEDLEGVISAVELLRGIGDKTLPSFEGKTVVVIGGGNVAMDAARTSVRLGAKKVLCVYRRRRQDMTALIDEVEGAIAEGVEILPLCAPTRIEACEAGSCAALWVKPQIPGEISGGRPKPVNSDSPEERVEADIVISAVGQKIESAVYEHAGIPVNRGMLVAMTNGQIFENGKLFAGGDCATGPATAIRAIAAGKVAAANIDEFLGFRHEITTDVEIPYASIRSRPLSGRINMTARMSFERADDFECIERGMTREGAAAESSRCLRCDHFGCGAFRGGRVEKW